MTATSTQAERTYGGWRVRRGWGLWGLRDREMLAVGLAAGVPLVALLVQPKLALLLLVPATIVLGLVLPRPGGVAIYERLGERLRWWRAGAKHHRTYRAGVLADYHRRYDLPGPLAPLALLGVETGRGGSVGVVHDRRPGYLTANVRVQPLGLLVADRSDGAAWVAAWNHWLASLGHLPAVRWVTVVVESSPAAGTALAEYQARRVQPTAPELARRLVGELAQLYPAQAADLDTRVSITFDPARFTPRPKTQPDACIEVVRQLAGLELSLASCGVAVAGPLPPGEVIRFVRRAMDPGARDELARAHVTEDLLQWWDAGPVASEEHWDRWVHDSGISVSWALQEAPRSEVVATVLGPLLAPGRWPRRVALVYEVLPAEHAANVAQGEVDAAAFRRQYRRRTGRDVNVRDVHDEERAMSVAREEAQGAGVTLATLFVTTSVTDESELAEAIADTEQRARQARLRLRRMWGAQLVGAATTLGVGVSPLDLARRRRTTR